MGVTADNMKHLFVMLALLAVSFCAALPTTDLVVPVAATDWMVLCRRFHSTAGRRHRSQPSQRQSLAITGSLSKRQDVARHPPRTSSTSEATARPEIMPACYGMCNIPRWMND